MNDKIDILMIAPGEGKDGGGGIAAYADMLTEKLGEDFNVKRIITLQDNNMINKIYVFLIAVMKTLRFIKVGKNKKVVHIHTAHGNSFVRKSIFVRLLKFFNIPIIIHIHSSSFDIIFEKLSPKKKQSIRNIFQQTDRVIVLSESWKKWYINKIEKRAPIVIYNGMNDLKTKKDQVSSRKDCILFIGRLGKRKGTYDLIKSFKQVLLKHSNAMLILAGDGEIEECKKLVNTLQIYDSVKFLGS